MFNLSGEKTYVNRSEYPRPQMVRDNWLNLNGIWEFELDTGLSGKEQGWHQEGKFSQTILVPFCPESKLSGIGQKDLKLMDYIPMIEERNLIQY